MNPKMWPYNVHEDRESFVAWYTLRYIAATRQKALRISVLSDWDEDRIKAFIKEINGGVMLAYHEKSDLVQWIITLEGIQLLIDTYRGNLTSYGIDMASFDVAMERLLK